MHYDVRYSAFQIVGLLWRDAPGDQAAAEAMLRELLAVQYRDPTDPKKHGVWPRQVPEDRVDPNWREFVGCTLILIREAFSDRLPEELLQEMDRALLYAAEGAKQRDVGAGYSNIAILSALLMQYVGSEEKRSDLRRAGEMKAQEVYERFRQHGTFDEFNSPTYYGVDLMGLALWRRFARSPEMRAWGKAMEDALWREIAAVYHADMRNMAGPYVRAYGMDMTQYCALVGLWIAVYLDDADRSPWPAAFGMHARERGYAPVFMLLDSRPPTDAAEHFRRFVGPRELVRKFGTSEAHIRLERDIMMGTARMNRAWEQHHPATIHWLSRNRNRVYWIALAGMTPQVVPKLLDDGIAVERTSDSTEPIVWWVYCPEMEFWEHHWQSEELTVSVEHSDGVALTALEREESSHHGAFTALQYRVPKREKSANPYIRLHLEKRP
ncbi:hypothetical protein JCM19992_17970 [Thermostilla marina]